MTKHTMCVPQSKMYFILGCHKSSMQKSSEYVTLADYMAENGLADSQNH